MRDIARATAQMDSIGLDQLEAVASLSTRRDRKYLVPIEVAEDLIGHGGLQVLEIDGLRTFRYESVYFDTPDRVSYQDAAYKRRRRFKVRTRAYLDSGTCALEVKTRQRRGLTEKHRFPHPIGRRTELTENGLEFIESFESIAPFSGQLQPTLTTRYSRTTFLEPDSGSRITIDLDLVCETPGGSRVALPDLAVVETKTHGKPCSVDRFLWNEHQRPISISKYGTGLAALDPRLPANKWNRVLRTHFRPALLGDPASDLRQSTLKGASV